MHIPLHRTLFKILCDASAQAGCSRFEHYQNVRAEFIGDHPEVIAVTHGGGEAQRTWPVEAIGPRLVDELAEWFQEVHAHERPHPPPPNL